VVEELLTPMGVRSLARNDAAFAGKYEGNIVSRDRAMHQGSVYPWLLAPLASAYLKVHGRGEETIGTVSAWIQPCLDFMAGDGMGQICEIFDGSSPKDGRGAPASALGAAELLRAYASEVLGMATLPRNGSAGMGAAEAMPVGSAARK
jgi:glycogen debranching enzyme